MSEAGNYLHCYSWPGLTARILDIICAIGTIIIIDPVTFGSSGRRRFRAGSRPPLCVSISRRAATPRPVPLGMPISNSDFPGPFLAFGTGRQPRDMVRPARSGAYAASRWDMNSVKSRTRFVLRVSPCVRSQIVAGDFRSMPGTLASR